MEQWGRSQGSSENVTMVYLSAPKSFINWLWLRNAEKFLVDNVNSFLTEIECRTGAQLFVMATYERTSGTVAITKYGFVKATSHHSLLIISPRFQTKHRHGQGHGDTFTDTMPNWKKNAWDNWVLYAQNHYSELCSFNKLNNLFIPSNRWPYLWWLWPRAKTEKWCHLANKISRGVRMALGSKKGQHAITAVEGHPTCICNGYIP